MNRQQKTKNRGREWICRIGFLQIHFFGGNMRTKNKGLWIILFTMPCMILFAIVYAAPIITVAYRYYTLDQARDRARVLGHDKGALFPWRTINGQEASTYYPLGTAQYHINADIAYALSLYLQVTGDIEYLVEKGAEILIETARVWADVGSFSECKNGKYCICDVTGPDEYNVLVDNNFYTNLMARENLRDALQAINYLKKNRLQTWEKLKERLKFLEVEAEQWEKIIENMYFPYDEILKIYPMDDGFMMRKPWDESKIPPEKRAWLYENYHPLFIMRHRMSKQADAILGMYLHSNLFSEEEIRRNYDFYQKVTLHHSSLSTCIFGIVASGIGYLEEAYDYFSQSARMDLDDYHNNFYAGIHAANMAGTWQATDTNIIRTDDNQALTITRDDFVNIGTGGKGINSVDGYRLADKSICKESGVLMFDNGGVDYWGNHVSNTKAPNIGCDNSGAEKDTMEGVLTFEDRSLGEQVLEGEYQKCMFPEGWMTKGDQSNKALFMSNETGSNIIQLPENKIIKSFRAKCDGIASLIVSANGVKKTFSLSSVNNVFETGFISAADEVEFTINCPTGSKQVQLDDIVLADAEKERKNIALNCPVETSGEDQNPGIYGNDGNEDTMWIHWGEELGQWWSVDLGALYQLSDFELVFEKDETPNAWKYQIEASENNKDFEIIFDASDNENGSQIQHGDFMSEKEYRYVRVKITGIPEEDYWPAFREFRLYQK